MTLKDELQTIDGIGPKTAEKIINIVDEHGSPVDQDELDWAIDQAVRGNEQLVIEFLESL